jgi:hypothetical protein
VFEDEVVTEAKVRYLRVPGLAGELALITIDNGHDHTRPSTFGPGGLASLEAALDEIAARRRIQVAEVYAVAGPGDPPKPAPVPAPGAAPPRPAAKGKSAAPQTAPARKAPARRNP